jgi:serine/threonine protein kinase
MRSYFPCIEQNELKCLTNIPLNCIVSLSSPHVVKYYGSYFKNTDLWIVMEYCGAGSVSDIIRLRNKTVSLPPRTGLRESGFSRFFWPFVRV